MNDSTLKRTISGIIMLVLFSSSVLVPSSALAATTGLNWSNPNQKNAFKLDASTLLNANNLMAVVGCTGIIDTATDAAMRLVSKVTNKLLNKLISGEVSVTDAALASQQKVSEKRQSCFDGLAYALAKQQLVSMTKSTMNWVNSGFNGDPMYVRDMNSLTNSIEGTILQQEVNLFKNSPAGGGDYPYGRNFALSQISSFKFGQNASNALKQNLSNYLSTAPGSDRYVESYTNNFSLGGWNGWLAFTQMPQNNPLGFNMMASQNLADSQNKAVTNTKAEVTQNGGMLDQKKCVMWNMVDDQGDYIYQDVQNENGITSQIKTTYIENPNFKDECIQYETVTPGSLIKDKVSKYLNSGETQLELADSLNEVLYSIFGNLISKFQQTGLSSLSSNTSDFSSVSAGIGANRIVDANGKTIMSADDGSGFDTGVNFDLTKDLGPIITTQQTYISTVNKLFPPLVNVMTSLGKLDYCIPGPNPNWQENSTNTKEAYYNWLNSITSVGNDRDYIFTTPDASTSVYNNYLNSIKDTTNTWQELKNSWYFIFSDSSSTKENQSMVDKILRNIDSKTTETDKGIAEYAQRAEALYGFKSPMQTQYLNVGQTNMTENPEYLPMAQTGLSITKDINSYAESIGEMTTTYQNRIIETNANIYKLKKLKEKVDIITIRAQNLRAKTRAENGLAPFTKECLDNERTIITQ
jgi:hypothetical protein